MQYNLITLTSGAQAIGQSMRSGLAKSNRLQISAKCYLQSSYLRFIPFWKESPTSQTTSPHVKTANREIQNTAPTNLTLLQLYSIQTLPRTQCQFLADWKQHASDLKVWRAFHSRAKLHLAIDGGLLGATGTHGWV